MKFNKFVALLVFVGIGVLSGCAHSVHEVYVSDFTPYAKMDQGEFVKGEAEQFVVLGFAQDTSYIERAKSQLISKCPSGAISGISTQISTNLGFFSWTNRALMQGLCVKSAANDEAAAVPGRKRQPSNSSIVN